MKKILTLVIALASTCMTFGQMMKDIPGLRFHAMSENGKWMLTVEQGWIGILNTETDDFQQYGGGDIGYDLGMGNMVTMEKKILPQCKIARGFFKPDMPLKNALR